MVIMTSFDLHSFNAVFVLLDARPWWGGAPGGGEGGCQALGWVRGLGLRARDAAVNRPPLRRSDVLVGESGSEQKRRSDSDKSCEKTKLSTK